MAFCFCFQIHVIKPVLPKLNNLFEYAVSEENGNSYFYFDFFITFVVFPLIVSLTLIYYRECHAHTCHPETAADILDTYLVD